MAQLPKDPIILLSYINTQLRDNYPSLKELCSSLHLNPDELCKKLSSAGYSYCKDTNQFQ